MRLIRAIFFLCALSYLFYAVLFGFFAPSFFQYMKIVPPNHWGYVHFVASTSFIFALMAFKVTKDPLREKALIPYIILYNFFYGAVIFAEKIIYGVPQFWVTTAIISSIYTVILILGYLNLRCPSHSCSKG